jgi:KUP system potassium uptake protein
VDQLKLLIAVLTLVFTFRTSTALAYAYGVAVTGTITTTTLLFFYIVRQQWRKPLWLVIPGAGVLLAIDLLFLSANLTKLPHGAWLPLVIGIAVFIVLTTWQKGRQLVTRQRALDEGSLHEFIEKLHARRPPPYRVPGTAIFLNRGKATAPLAMRANVEHNHVLHEHVIILAVETLPILHVPDTDRLETDDLGYKEDRISHVTARFGYMDTPSVPSLLPLIRPATPEGMLDGGRSPTSCPRSRYAAGTPPA